MEKLPQKTRDDITTVEELFAKWHEALETLCMSAVFRRQHELLVLLQENLERSQEAIVKMQHHLDEHLQKKPIIEFPTTNNNITESQTNGNRMAASLPGMNSSKPIAVGPASLISSLAAAKIGSPMGVSSSVASENDEHVFMEPYKKPLPDQWRTVVSRRGGSTHETPESGRPERPPTSDGGSSFDESEQHERKKGVEQPNKVFLLNLDHESTPKSVANYFGEYGSVVDVKIFRFPSGESRGQGWIEFLTAAEAAEVLKRTRHRLDGRDVQVKPFVLREARIGANRQPARTYQIFLGGIPSHLSKAEVISDLAHTVKVRDLRLISERGYAYLDCEYDEDAEKLLKQRFVRVGEKEVECKENRRP